ncbi:hypothetical protein TRFO_10279 [Tritrichomonas foetus]|uniref:Anaphase-promoting complex subunit 4 WD40 domain-containing protein n=1 Tax=Tritrichomonas foetus TaxID=1144522 RepID=A0A1J4JC93_9EUKA|nr:hypothetical protein TRFO_10279 [Tritrichomonas foetus]|eukprot:OHS95871.1 hypothetical protein TRFO_10279 [Tritrichomonas foetus]
MSVEFQHQITSLKANVGGNGTIALTLLNGNISLVSPQDLRILANIPTSDATPQSASYSSAQCGSILAVGFSDGTVRLYQNNKEIHRFEKQNGAILSVAFHPSKCIVAAACLNGTFNVHTNNGNSWQSSTTDASHMGLTAIAWGSDSGSGIQHTLIVGGADGVIRVFRSISNNWEQICAAQVHNGWVRSISTPNAPIGAVQKIASCSDDQTAAVLKIVNNEITVSQIQPLSVPVQGVSWAMVDKTLVLAHTNGSTSMWKETENNEWTLSKNYQ